MLHESKILTYRLGGYPSSFGFDGGLHSLELGPAFLVAVQNVRFISCFPLSRFMNCDKFVQNIDTYRPYNHNFLSSLL